MYVGLKSAKAKQLKYILNTNSDKNLRLCHTFLCNILKTTSKLNPQSHTNQTHCNRNSQNTERKWATRMELSIKVYERKLNSINLLLKYNKSKTMVLFRADWVPKFIFIKCTVNY